MKKQLKAMLRTYRKQARDFNRAIIASEIEKKYSLSSAQKLHLGVGTNNLDLVIPFDTYMDRQLLNRATLEFIRQQAQMRSILVNENGEIMWQQHAAPGEIAVPFLDISHYQPTDQEKILNWLEVQKSLKRFSAHSPLYRFIIIKDILTGYAKKKLKPGSGIYRVIVKIGSLTKYLKRNCRRNSLLYRMLLVKKNEKSHQLFIRLDHIIGDDTSMELIKSGISKYYNSRGQVRPQDIPSYDQYIRQVNHGPRDIAPGELCSLLAVHDYKRYSAIIGDHIDKMCTKSAYRFNYCCRFNDKGNLNETRAWEIAFILAMLLCKSLFNVPKIAARLVSYGRNYHGKTFFNTVGAFWDLIPILVEVNEQEPLKMVQRVNETVELAAGHNINFVSMLLNEALHEPWKEVIDLVAMERLNPPDTMIVIDFLGKKIGLEENESSRVRTAPVESATESRRQRKKRYLHTRSHGGFVLYLYYTAEAVFLELDTLLKIEDRKLTQMLDKKIEYIEFKITPN